MTMPAVGSRGPSANGSDAAVRDILAAFDLEPGATSGRPPKVTLSGELAGPLDSFDNTSGTAAARLHTGPDDCAAASAAAHATSEP
jgi:hypothetical protein